MSAQKSLKSFVNNPWITGIILLIFVGLSIYYFLLPDDTKLFLFGKEFPLENKKVISLLTFFFGLVISFLINLLTGALQKSDSPKIVIENIINTQPENTSLAENNVENDKFYPIQFFPDLKYFEGRVNLLKEIKTTLDRSHRASIHDISGIGKTFFTYKFVEQFQKNYERIFFVRASKEEMSSSLAEIGLFLNPSLKVEPDQTKLGLSFKNWLEKNDKWLVIYDNVDLPEELFPFVPSNLKGDCIFTSNFPLTENLAVNVNIEKLSEAESKRLLFSRANNKPHQKPHFTDEKEKIAFEKIISEIDGHPLALNTTGSFISKNQFNFQKFAKKLEDEPNILLENEDGFDKYQRKSVLKAFSIAFADASVKKSDDKFKNSPILTRKILGAVSFIAPDEIPEELLRLIFELFLQPQTFFQKIWLFIFGNRLSDQQKENLWQEVRLKLLGYDLLKFDKSLTILTTHRLVQKVIESKLNNKEQKEILRNTIVALNGLFDYSKYETKANCELYAPHAIVLVEKTEKADLLTEDIARIYHKIGRHFRETVKYDEAIVYQNKAIAYFQTLPEKEQTDLASCLNETALVYRSQGRYDKAIKKYEEALSIDEKTIGKEHPQYANHLNNLANVYYSQGRYDEAIAKYEEALSIDEKTIGKEHSHYAIRLNNLASVYYSQGKYDEAIEKFEEALSIDEKTIGKEHPQYATRLNNLAVVYQSQGRYDEAIEKYEEVLSIIEKTISKEHPHYASGLNNLAYVYRSQGKFREALDLFLEAERIWEKTLPENHPYIERVREHIEICRAELGDE